MQTANDYYDTYTQLVKHEQVADALAFGLDNALRFFATIPSEKWDYCYAPGKWSIKEVVQHIIDTERIFSYRALCFARGETISLPGYDENVYAQNSYAAWRNIDDIIEDYKATRLSTQALFKSFAPEALTRRGIANGMENWPQRIGFIIAGHELHHLNVIHERYLGD